MVEETSRLKSDARKKIGILVRDVVDYGGLMSLVVLENMVKKGWAGDFLDEV